MIRPFCFQQRVAMEISSDEESINADSDEIDSDLEFHLYSQIHYSTSELNTTSDTSPTHMQSESPPPTQEFQNTENYKTETKDGIQSPEKALAISQKTSRSESIDEQDIALLKKYLGDEEDDFIPESWEIVDSVTDQDSDDAGLDIHVSKDQPTEDVECKAWIPDEGTKESWKIDDRDKMKIDGRNRYYEAKTGGSRTRCRNCNNTGHKARDCPEEKALPVCFMCGGRGHVGRDCPERRNHRYVSKRVQCNRCGQDGHIQADCPDLWRQFHITTELGPIKIPRIPVKLNNNIQCYNCASRQHFGYECNEPRYQQYCPLQKPLVHRYDHRAIAEIPKDLRKKLDKKKSEYKRRPGEEYHPHRHPNTHIIFQSPSPPRRKFEKSLDNKRKRDFNYSTSPKHMPEKRRKHGSVIGQSKKRKEHFDSSENFHHTSQRFDKRVVAMHNKNRYDEPSRKKQKHPKFVQKQESFNQSARGFRRRPY